MNNKEKNISLTMHQYRVRFVLKLGFMNVITFENVYVCKPNFKLYFFFQRLLKIYLGI
jgi:hypothetical protein